jgi:hypothetical protein
MGRSRQDGRTTAPQELEELEELEDDEEAGKPQREHWKIDKAAMRRKLAGQSWAPTRKLSPETMDGIRALHKSYPDQFSTPVLAKQFDVSPEAIRRILKSKWTPTPEEAEDRNRRWESRGMQIWERLADKGVKPPQKWRELGVGRIKENESFPRWKRAKWREGNVGSDSKGFRHNKTFEKSHSGNNFKDGWGEVNPRRPVGGGSRSASHVVAVPEL